MKTDSLIGVISLVSGFISLGFTIYFTNNIPLQIGFAIIMILSAIIFFVYINYNKTEILEKKHLKLQEEITLLKDSIDIHSRLAKLEQKIE